ncbi:hypothetical protein EDB81DRAFT_515339 [Dactylonectria macrodidyma]|uniref:Secreted protein n=1 Tax=Dactylonectria macrodidyma TaxID=307937 RepID=A0A9P9J4U9_9HYPO|nr:hypothetical protein EDB81DRAFT_515339 [Dactylonectria macrodidyma]
MSLCALSAFCFFSVFLRFSVFLLSDEMVRGKVAAAFPPPPLPFLGCLPRHCAGTRSSQHPSDSIVPAPPTENRKSGILAFCKVVNPASKVQETDRAQRLRGGCPLLTPLARSQVDLCS